MSNLFDAVAQVYDFIQVIGVTTLLDGRIYQNQFPSDGEVIAEGADRFIVIRSLEPNIWTDPFLSEYPINISVFVKERAYRLWDEVSLNNIEKALDTALEATSDYDHVSYCSLTKVFSHVLSENPFSKNHTLMVIRINLTINKK